jgi:hypothetical protein
VKGKTKTKSKSKLKPAAPVVMPKNETPSTPSVGTYELLGNISIHEPIAVIEDGKEKTVERGVLWVGTRVKSVKNERIERWLKKGFAKEV